MSPWMQFTIDIIVFIGIPSIIMYGIYQTRVLAQRMPENTAPILEQFSRMAVQKVEQQYREEERTRKKTLAIQTMKVLYAEHRPHLPLPSDVAIDIAIESAVFYIKGE